MKRVLLALLFLVPLALLAGCGGPKSGAPTSFTDKPAEDKPKTVSPARPLPP